MSFSMFKVVGYRLWFLGSWFFFNLMLHSNSNLGGCFGPELKHAGYDTIVVSGKSPTPVYLWINNDTVELRDASHLWGKDTCETQRMIKEELKVDEAQIMCVGPAGENKVYAATIEHGAGVSASRTGTGAIMGDKKFEELRRKSIEETKKKIKDSVKSDNFIVQSISHIDEINKICNILTKRLREWYELYNPEFSRKVKDHLRKNTL